MTYSLSLQDAWQPLPAAGWDAAAARHLLRRAGWTAVPAEVDRALGDGLSKTLDRLFPEEPALFPVPKLTERIALDAPETARRIADADPEQKRLINREERERSQAALQDLTLRWLAFAAIPGNAAFQKWVLFLSDVYVVAFDKVPRAPLIYHHFDVIARRALGPAPELSKAVSRSPAMVLYLDLNQNRKGEPNENFARELFELFILGEGNYTEKDVKEAARAFTGYRLIPGSGFTMAQRQHDQGRKTVFGKTGYFTGDDVIDLAYTLPAAGAFLPHELVKFYLSDTMLPREYLYAMGDHWRAQGYDLRLLARSFFGSRMFFAPEFRGDFIKSPVQFYLGLLQDLNLDMLPVPRFVINPMRQMGQILYNPPNVRGWVGGRNWINSASLAARMGLVESIFAPVNEDNLTADEQLDVIAAKQARADVFTVADERFGPLENLDPAAAAHALASDFLPVAPAPDFQSGLRDFIAAGPQGPDRVRRLRRALITLLESPEYQLC